ncbi:hypothetical protein [Methanosphaera sp. WGK6]|uniref:hypothetical protein n=1 Tax=Methanosphaera sp. WGK6 TaxID=1561964 RepID=UPI00084BEDA0|nr:hypothetical protein [Methanosphaera sp. WGK6]OED29514.1 hypothetical protein NL43_07855 [Methanosphaera sp. WGK6]
MKIKNIKIKFDEGHINTIEINYHDKITKTQVQENNIITNKTKKITDNKEQLHVQHQEIQEEQLEDILHNIKLKK